MPQDEEIVPIAIGTRERSRDTSDEDEVLAMRQVKIKYGALMCLVFFAALLFRWIPQLNWIFHPFSEMKNGCDGDNHCIGNTVTLRLSFSLFIFYALHAVFATGWSKWCFGPKLYYQMLTQWFWVRVVAFVILFIATMFIDFDFFVGYSHFALYAAVGFLIMQSLILLQFAFDLNDWLIPSDDAFMDDSEEARLKRWAVCGCFSCYAFAITLLSLCYYWFAPASCPQDTKSLHYFFISFTLVYGVLTTLAAVWTEKGSILISGFVFAYLTMTTWSALTAGATDDTCDMIYTDPSKINVNTVLSLMVACGAVIHSSISSGTNRHALTMADVDADEDFAFSFFFVCFALGACYLAMTLCSWNTGVHAAAEARPENSEQSMWIKMGTVWFTMFIFAWATLARYVCGANGCCCQDRSFD